MSTSDFSFLHLFLGPRRRALNPSRVAGRRPQLVTICAGLLVAAALWPTAAQAQYSDVAYLGDVFTEAGMTATVPVVVLDYSATALGVDAGAGRRIQNLSISARVTPADKVTSVSFVKAGATAGITPLFETQVTDSTEPLTTWVLAFDEANNPIPLTLDEGDLVGYLQVSIAASANPGDVIDLKLDADRSAVGNQGGSLTATGSNNGLLLLDGTVRVEAPPIFVDGFETGDTTQWSLAVP